jgi:hypothetical protein
MGHGGEVDGAPGQPLGGPPRSGRAPRPHRPRPDGFTQARHFFLAPRNLTTTHETAADGGGGRRSRHGVMGRQACCCGATCARWDVGTTGGAWRWCRRSSREDGVLWPTRGGRADGETHAQKRQAHECAVAPKTRHAAAAGEAAAGQRRATRQTGGRRPALGRAAAWAGARRGACAPPRATDAPGPARRAGGQAVQTARAPPRQRRPRWARRRRGPGPVGGVDGWYTCGWPSGLRGRARLHRCGLQAPWPAAPKNGEPPRRPPPRRAGDAPRVGPPRRQGGPRSGGPGRARARLGRRHVERAASGAGGRWAAQAALAAAGVHPPQKGERAAGRSGGAALLNQLGRAARARARAAAAGSCPFLFSCAGGAAMRPPRRGGVKARNSRGVARRAPPERWKPAREQAPPGRVQAGRGVGGGAVRAGGALAVLFFATAARWTRLRIAGAVLGGIAPAAGERASKERAASGGEGHRHGRGWACGAAAGEESSARQPAPPVQQQGEGARGACPLSGSGARRGRGGRAAAPRRARSPRWAPLLKASGAEGRAGCAHEAPPGGPGGAAGAPRPECRGRGAVAAAPARRRGRPAAPRRARRHAHVSAAGLSARARAPRRPRSRLRRGPGRTPRGGPTPSACS